MEVQRQGGCKSALQFCLESFASVPVVDFDPYPTDASLMDSVQP